MFAFTNVIVQINRISTHCNTTREGNKNHTNWKEKNETNSVEDNMIVYLEYSK